MNREEYFHNDWARLQYSRTKFRMPFQHTTAFNAGDIVPLEVEQIYPGDSIKSDVSYLLRMFTPIGPLMSNMYLDIYSFFVPMRLVWEHWEEFYGQNNTSAWTENFEYTIPQNTWNNESSSDDNHCLGDYLGLPNSSEMDYTLNVSDLWRRAYLNIYNNWFRDENIIAPILYSVGDELEAEPAYNYGSAPLKAAKFHDYFTSLLPEPQKGDAPVIGDDLAVVPLSKTNSWGSVGASFYDGEGSVLHGPLQLDNTYGALSVKTGDTPTSGIARGSNLWAKMTITIEDIRNAAVVTHVLEKLASAGSRYVESLVGLWGVTPSNASLQIPEYLGGKRFAINVSELMNSADTLSSDGSTGAPVGQPGAFVKNGRSDHLFNKAFTEHGMLFTVGVVRIEQTYFQGVERKFTDKSFFDFYLPATANIGNQPVYLEQLSWMAARLRYEEDSEEFPGDDFSRKYVLGFSEAWAHLRYTPYRLSSIMRPGAVNALSYYTASDVIPDEVALNQEFIEQGEAGLNRCLVVPSATRGGFQFFGDFKFNNIWTRILPAHSVPGLTRI